MIALCGCMMQEPEVVEKLKKSYRFVDLIFGTHNIYKFAELLATRMESGRAIISAATVLYRTSADVREAAIRKQSSVRSSVLWRTE